MNCLFRCHQCSYEEWRPEGQENWLCAVCGYMMWSVVADDGSAAASEAASPVGEADNPVDDEDP